MLIAMTVFFIGIVIFAFRPGSRQLHDDIAGIPLRNDDVPLSDIEERR
jgi:cytochrome c oxidase cbb3-type subunit 4